MPKPRVLINALSLTEGGGRSYVLNLTRELARDDRGFDVTLLAAAGQLSVADVHGIPLETVSLPALRGGRLLARVGYEQLRLPRRARSFDLLFCIADLSPAVAATPTVVALRNLNIYDHRYLGDLRIKILERLVRIGLRRVRRMVVPTRAAAQVIAARTGLPESRLVVIPHGVSPEPFATVPPPEEAEGARAPYLFLAASLEPHKNIGVLIESLRYVSDPTLELWVAGSRTINAPHAAWLEGLVARLGLEERVRFLGSVPYDRILGYYRGARAFVFPSLLESFGHPLLEAMLAGTPLIASDIPASREVAGDAALFFPPGDARQLAARIDALALDAEATRSRVERGRALALTFSWQASIDRLCRTFESVLADTQPGDRSRTRAGGSSAAHGRSAGA